jgi:hypothetical protein
VSLSGTLQGNGITATLQAALPASASANIPTINPVPVPNISGDVQPVSADAYPTVSFTGHTIKPRIAIAQTNGEIGFEVQVAQYDPDYDEWSSYGVAYTVGEIPPAQIPSPSQYASFGLAFYFTHVGLGMLPQSSTITVTNISDGNAVLAQFTVTINPEPE